MSTITDDTADVDLDKFWEGIIARLNEKTKWDLNSRSALSVDQVLLKINPPKDEKPEKHAKTKQVWKTTMVCVHRLGVFVQRFGSIIAQGASVAFGPAGQCFNAINFIISATQEYEKIFANLTTLLERVSVFLENLNIYMDQKDAETKLDKRLRKTCYRVLEHFLKIMATSHDLVSSHRARFGLKVKSVMFGEDNGISSSLATLETLVSDFTKTQISVILMNSSEAVKGIRSMDRKLDVISDALEKQAAVGEQTVAILGQINVAVGSRADEKKEKEDLDAIKKAISLDEDKKWDQQNELWKTHVEGSGEWLLQKPYFKPWADARGTATNTIILRAPSGYGKSYLTSRVVNHLQYKHRDDPKVVVAYYYLTPGKTSGVNNAIRTILWQLVSNQDYRKAARKICDSTIDASSVPELFRKMLTDPRARSVEATFYIILDGVDDANEGKDVQDLWNVLKQINQMSEDKSSRLVLRAFVSGTRDALNAIPQDLTALPPIDLEPDPQTNEPAANQADLELFVADRVESTQRLLGLDTELKDRIRRELARGARGLYSRLRYLLEDLSNIQNTSDIDNILAKANQSLLQMIEDRVAVLDRTLSPNEINELNTLLAWAYAANAWLTIGQHEAVLSLSGDGQSVGLKSRIETRYQELLSMEPGAGGDIVKLRDGVEDFLLQAHEKNAERVGPSRRSTAAIQAPEVALVQKVLQTHFKNVFGDGDVYTRFDFDDFFMKKLGASAVRIRLAPAESAVQVAQGCLLSICERREDERSKALFGYAAEWFAYQIGKLKLEETDTPTRQELGRKLTRVLQEPELIDAWMAPEQIHNAQYLVFYGISRELLRDMHLLLKDPLVQKGMSDMPTERQWVSRATAGDEPSFDLYSKLATIMAKRWFESPEIGDGFQCFDWYVRYFATITPWHTRSSRSSACPPIIDYR